MENNLESIEKKRFLSRKVYGIPMFVLILLGIGLISVLGLAIWYATIPVSVTVSEALSTTTESISVDAIYVGESIIENILIENKANVDLKTKINWEEVSNENLIAYTTDMPKEVVLTSGENTVTVKFTISSDSSLGQFTGRIKLERIA